MLLHFFLHVIVINFYSVFSDTDLIHRHKRSDDFVPCERGWYYFRDKCYKVVGRKVPERISWDRALARCKSWGADLASIQSQEEQDFVVSFLQLDIQYWVWIGLTDREKESDYRWSDGSFFNYTNWKEGEPAGFKDETEDCVHMVMEPGINVGKWNDRACDVSEGYICEMKANRRRRNPNPMYCSSQDGGGWKYQTSCYHVVTEVKSWQNAERHCQEVYDGHLLTIHDTLEDVFLDYITTNVKEVWIGIKVEEQLQQKWTSGWYVSYNAFDKESNYVGDTCVARKSRKEWIMIPCSTQLSFICEITKVNPPALKPPPIGSHCPKAFEDWRDLGGEYCYHIEMEKSLSFYEASFDCKRKGGDLLSLHSREEAEILLPFVQYIRWSIYIGLFRLFPNEDTFAWTDGSALDYEDWTHNEPNSEEEKCVEAVINDIIGARKMKWNDIKCEDKKPYICSVKKIRANTSVIEETDCASQIILKALNGVFLCVVLVIILMGVVLYYFRPCGVDCRKKSATASTEPPSPLAIYPSYTSTTELTGKDDVRYEVMT